MMTKHDVNRKETERKYREMYQARLDKHSYEKIREDFGYKTIESVRTIFSKRINPYIKRLEAKKEPK